MFCHLQALLFLFRYEYRFLNKYPDTLPGGTWSEIVKMMQHGDNVEPLDYADKSRNNMASAILALFAKNEVNQL